MRLTQLEQTSLKVASTRSRLAKVEALADCLRRLDPQEVPAGVAYLSGEVLQAKLGIGYASVSAAATVAATEPTLQLKDVDSSLEALCRISGAGSSAQRQSLLRDLFGRATAEEQHFLQRLLLGELRQGAL